MSTASEPVETALPVVKLQLDDGGFRTLDTQPNLISFGELQLRSWQVFPVRSRTDEFAGYDAYLLKINYDLMLEPEVPAPSWFEVGFAMTTPGQGLVTVIDALPRHVRQARDETTYAIDERLDFVVGQGVRMPAVSPKVVLFGLGGDGVRWWFRDVAEGEVQPGAYTAWATFVVPGGCEQVGVEVKARFDFQDALEYRTTNEPARFDLRLTETSKPGPAITGTGAAVTDTGPAITGTGAEVTAVRAEGAAATFLKSPRVFVSYTHDTPRHADAVLRFSTFLMTECGIDVHMDRWDLESRRDWYPWAIEQITSADYVIVVASPNCKTAGDSPADNEKNRGMQAEMSIIRDLLQDERVLWLKKVLPVVLPGRKIEEIPLFLQPRAADHYIVSDFTLEGTESLVRALTGQPEYIRPRVRREVPVMPPRNAG